MFLPVLERVVVGSAFRVSVFYEMLFAIVSFMDVAVAGWLFYATFHLTKFLTLQVLHLPFLIPWRFIYSQPDNSWSP